MSSPLTSGASECGSAAGGSSASKRTCSSPCSDNGATPSTSRQASARARIAATWAGSSSALVISGPVMRALSSGRGRGVTPGHAQVPLRPVALDRHEPVADVAHGADPGLVLGAEHRAQPPDVDVDRTRAAEVVVAPDLLEQLRPGEDPARVLGQ